MQPEIVSHPLSLMFWLALAGYPALLWVSARIVRARRVRMAATARCILDDPCTPARARTAIRVMLGRSLSPWAYMTSIPRMPVRAALLVYYAWWHGRFPSVVRNNGLRSFVTDYRLSLLAANPLLAIVAYVEAAALMAMVMPLLLLAVVFRHVALPHLRDVATLVQIGLRLSHG